ncbi:MAG: HD domain-containing protein [Lachnospiraceae bacterium]
MRKKLKKLDNELLNSMLMEVSQESRFNESKNYIQHGNTSVYTHSVSVAICTLKLSRMLPGKKNRRELVRAALLHDYFLYDWHKEENRHQWHGFRHPEKAAKNASRDFKLSEKEQEIIRRHMFPLTPIPPNSIEGVLVCVADKICSIKEIVS